MKEAAIQYRKGCGKVLVLFLDGVDLLAKHNKEMCCHLITHAKVMANEGTLRIVMVSSEGTINYKYCHDVRNKQDPVLPMIGSLGLLSRFSQYT